MSYAVCGNQNETRTKKRVATRLTLVEDTLGSITVVVALLGKLRLVDRQVLVVSAKTMAMGVGVREQTSLPMRKRCVPTQN